MRFTKAFANKIFAATPLIIGAAFLALASFTPRLAFAQSLTLTPTSAVNIAGPANTHTVNGLVTGVTGHCAEIGDPLGLPDSDGSGVDACASDADCADFLSDDFCSFSGFTVGFVVQSGPNAGQALWATTDPTGSASFTVTDTGGTGTDSIQGCLDTDTSGTNDESTGTDATDVQACIIDGSGDGDYASLAVTKQWTAALAGTVDLEPSSAVNPVGALHSVTATVNGVARCFGGTNDGTLCTDDFACIGGGTCTDKSGLTVGFNINSGPNAGDKGWFLTDASGVATLPSYTSLIAGLDVLQACLDADSFSPGVPDENTSLVSECITDTSSEPDFASNLADKRWDPTITVQNKDEITGQFSTDPAFNPVGTSHTVQATVVGLANICSGGTAGANTYASCNIANGNGDCTNGGTCGVAGYPVFFSVTNGPNAGDIAGYGTTDGSGLATNVYTDLAGAGVDTIAACVDADLADAPLPDDSNYTQCVGDYPAQADIPSSNSVTKTWLTSFVTGGGKVIKAAKTWDSFGGVVGIKPDSTLTVGEWDETAHPSSGGNVSCHWNTFNSLKFGCTVAANCVTTPDTVQFVASAGKCKNTGGPETVTVTIVDGRKKPDTIKVIGATGAGSILNLSPAALASGNFTLHP